MTYGSHLARKRALALARARAERARREADQTTTDNQEGDLGDQDDTTDRTGPAA